MRRMVQPISMLRILACKAVLAGCLHWVTSLSLRVHAEMSYLRVACRAPRCALHAICQAHHHRRGALLIPVPIVSWTCSYQPDLGLQGSIPSNGWSLPSTLITLNLASNQISGQVPSSWPGLPSSIQTLDLSGNMLSGGLSASLTVPSSLQQFAVYKNQLTGK